MKINREDDFVYVNHNCDYNYFNGITLELFSVWCEYLYYDTDLKQAAFRSCHNKEIASKLNITKNMVEKYIRRMVENGLIFRHSYGLYVVNPNAILLKGHKSQYNKMIKRFCVLDGKLVYKDSLI